MYVSFSSWRAACAGCLLLCLGATATASPSIDRESIAPSSLSTSSLDPVVLRHAMEALSCARRSGHPAGERLAIIDFRLPSTLPRLWVIEIETGKLLYEEFVAHGRGSGDNIASRFSNIAESHTSSLGLFLTMDTYEGGNGYSLRLQGLEPGINDKALERYIVMHGADYVSEGFIKTAGRLGRSYGCPAVRREIAKPLIDTLSHGQYLYIHAQDPSWPGTPVSLGCATPDKILQTAGP